MGRRHKLYCTVAAAALLATFNGAATAADAPTWAGFYMGGHLGYGWSKMSGEGSGPTLLTGDMKLSGAIAGVHAGYNWQYSQLVFGVEGDISGVFGTNWSKNVAEVSSPASGAHGELLGLASLRGRLGWAFDRTLVYATGGVAWGLYKGQLMSGSNVNLESKVATGAVVGGGIEWKYNQNLSFRLEGLHYMFDKTFSGDSEPAEGGFLKIHNADVIRVGASYHF